MLELQHETFFLETVPSSINDITNGDVVELYYEGATRKVLVLNPNWEQKLHALLIDNIPRPMLLNVISLVARHASSFQLYKTFLSQQSEIISRGYRTFDRSKIGRVQYILYDMNFNAAHSNTMVARGMSLILGHSVTGHVYASEFPTLKFYAQLRAQSRGLYVGDMKLDTSKFAMGFKNPKFISRWDHFATGDSKIKQSDHLNTLLSSGGVFILPDDMIDNLQVSDI